jgi:hypothetical protein
MPRGECPTRPVMLLSGRRVSDGPTDCLYALPWRVVVNAEARSCLAACHFFGFGFTHVARQLQATRPTPKVYFCVPPLHIRARGQRPSCSVIFYGKSSYITAIQHRGQIRSWVSCSAAPTCAARPNVPAPSDSTFTSYSRLCSYSHKNRPGFLPATRIPMR